jgi:hypothetical protein
LRSAGRFRRERGKRSLRRLTSDAQIDFDLSLGGLCALQGIFGYMGYQRRRQRADQRQASDGAQS